MHNTNPFVSDDDKYGHDFIGEARIPLFHLKPQEPRHMNVYLEKHCPVNISVFRLHYGNSTDINKSYFCKCIAKIKDSYVMIDIYIYIYSFRKLNSGIWHCHISSSS